MDRLAPVHEVAVENAEPPNALAEALAVVLGANGKETWKTLVAALPLLGSERLEVWKQIAAGIGVSITRARELSDRRRSFRLPVRYGARGVYLTRLARAQPHNSWITCRICARGASTPAAIVVIS